MNFTEKGKAMLRTTMFLIVLAVAGCASGGKMDARMAECPDSPNCVSSVSKMESHYIAPISFSGDPENAMERIEKVILSMKRSEIAIKETGYLKAVFTSAVFRFRDDVECLLDRDKSVINIRSASRAGYSDFGVNRARVEEIRKLLGHQE